VGTISIEEFRNLIGADSPDRKKPYGKFGLNSVVQKKQCENLKVGDKVFFLDATYTGLSEKGVPQVDIVVTMARIVED